jgi:hypothetical protein
MATARAYDAYQDTGMAFSEDDIRSYDPQAWAQERVVNLQKIANLMARKAAITDVKPKWWADFVKYIYQNIGWYCVAMEIPKPEELAPPDPRSVQGKALTIMAQELTEEDALGRWRSKADSALKYVVTIGRACAGNSPVSGWKKKESKLNNKLANCVMREVSLAMRMEQELESKGGGKSKQDEETD